MIGVAVPAWAASTPPGTNEQGYCTPEPQGDNVHASGGDASGHGWWLEGSCTAPYATVTVQLYEEVNGTWEEKASADGSLPSGGGSGNRITARAVCASSTATNWRSYVSAVVYGEQYGSAQIETPVVSIACRL